MFARARGQVVGKKFVDVFPEVAGSLLASKLEEARKRQGVLSFRTELGEAGRQSSYAVRLRPFSAGISVFCQRAEATGQAPPGESA
jgi:hypothetical protein